MHTATSVNKMYLLTEYVAANTNASFPVTKHTHMYNVGVMS